MSSTFFSAPPHWHWLIAWYFFLGGLAGGSYFLAVLIEQFGTEPDRPLARIGYLVAFPLACICGLLLTVDLGRPERFWHMLIQSNTGWPMFKGYSPMSVGAWGLLLFSGCAALSFARELAGMRRLPSWPWLHLLRPGSAAGRGLGLLGGLFGFFLAGYTGVLLSVTNRPIWADTTLLGLLFLASAASTSAALLLLLGAWTGGARESLGALSRFDARVLIVEIVALAALVGSLGRVAAAWLSGWGVLLAGAALLGMLLPLYLHRHRQRAGHPWWVAPTLVLLGGAMLRAVIVFSVEAL
jgi:formate-dependent nitrite reductase membrane component NrfD